MSILRRGFMIVSVLWVALLSLAPFAASQPAPAPVWYALAFAVYGAGHFVCHQLPERSFQLWSAQLPVCARCTGIYVGGAIAAFLATVRVNTVRLPVTDPHRARVLIAVAALPTLGTLVYEWTTGVMPSNAIRAFAGAPLGAAIAFIVIRVCSLPPRDGRDTRE